jgi:hypothetical protein
MIYTKFLLCLCTKFCKKIKIVQNIVGLIIGNLLNRSILDEVNSCIMYVLTCRECLRYGVHSYDFSSMNCDELVPNWISLVLVHF